MRDIKLPMSEEDAKSLKLGEMVTVSGLLFTGRSRFHIRAIADDIYPPIDYEKINCFLHVGPVMKPNGSGWDVVGEYAALYPDKVRKGSGDSLYLTGEQTAPVVDQEPILPKEKALFGRKKDNAHLKIRTLSLIEFPLLNLYYPTTI